jgi:hypothetical protein
MMKTIRYMLITFAAILGLTALAACAQPVTPAGETTGRVILSVSAGAPGAARTILPTGTPEFSKYDLDFNSGAKTFPGVTPADLAAGLELTAGTWTVEVKAYRKFTPTSGMNAGTETEYLAAQGTSASFTVGAEELRQVPVPLTPASLTDTAVKGIFTYKVSFPADITSAYLTLDSTGVPLTSGQTVSVELTPGQYDLSIFVQKGPLSAGAAEKVHVYAGLESKAEFIFEDEDFVRPAPLSVDTWKNGAFTAYPQTAWYSFPADAGKTYALEWEGYSNNSTAYTGYVEISAYDSMMQIGYGYRGDSPITLSVSSNDTIYVRVQAYSSGTYRIKYYDASAMPPLTAPFVFSWIPGYTIGWSPVGGATSYTVYRSSTGDTALYTQVGSVSDGGSYEYFFTDTDVSSGTYWYQVQAVNGNGPGLYSSAPVEVSPPTPLSADTWEEGTLTAYRQAWYTFDAAAFVSYYLQWEDNYNSAYTGEVNIEAYQGSNGNGIGYGPSGSSPLSLSVSSTDTVYVRVQANGSLGTYRIKYDAVPPTLLTADTWEVGEFTAYGQAAWYSFAATAGTTYNLQWEDTYNSSYTGRVYVEAYQSNGTQLTSGSSSPLTLSVSSADTIYVRVQPNGTLGTYRIKYRNCIFTYTCTYKKQK